MAQTWILQDHEGTSGRREVRDHYDRAPDDVKAAFDVHWEYLSVRSRSEWVRPKADKLVPEHKNGYREFFEFRFKAASVQQRPLGCFELGAGAFTLLIYAIEQGNKFRPKTAVEICGRRRTSILEGAAESVDWTKEREKSEPDEVRKIEAPDI